jgi:phosphoglycolate phosphatase
MSDLNKYKHIIWDWNGTLLDDVEVCVQILNNILAEYNFPPLTIPKYQKHFDFPVIKFYQYLGFDFEAVSFDLIANMFIDQYNIKRFECKLHARALEVLDLLRSKGCELSILSAYQQNMLEELVKFCKVDDYFTHIVGLGDYYAAGKVQSGKLLVEKLDHSPADVLLIGDTIHDFEVAKTIGVDCILIAGGHNSKERLESCNTPTLDSLEELLNL